MDITISGPAGSSKSELAKQIAVLAMDKTSIRVLNIADAPPSVFAKRWASVKADVITFDGCVSEPYLLEKAQKCVSRYRSYNPSAVAVYVIQTI